MSSETEKMIGQDGVCEYFRDGVLIARRYPGGEVERVQRESEPRPVGAKAPGALPDDGVARGEFVPVYEWEGLDGDSLNKVGARMFEPDY